MSESRRRRGCASRNPVPSRASILSRPDVRNAFDEVLIAELTRGFRRSLGGSGDARA